MKKGVKLAINIQTTIITMVARFKNNASLIMNKKNPVIAIVAMYDNGFANTS